MGIVNHLLHVNPSPTKPLLQVQIAVVPDTVHIAF